MKNNNESNVYIIEDISPFLKSEEHNDYNAERRSIDTLDGIPIEIFDWKFLKSKFNDRTPPENHKEYHNKFVKIFFREIGSNIMFYFNTSSGILMSQLDEIKRKVDKGDNVKLQFKCMINKHSNSKTGKSWYKLTGVQNDSAKN